MIVKLCGIRRSEDINYVNEFMPDYVGFIFAENSRRTVSPEYAAEIGKNLSSYIKKVGVFVNQPVEFIQKTVEQAKLDVYQLHGDEDLSYINEISNKIDADIWKAVRIRSENDIIKADKLGVDALLLDSFSSTHYGGTGNTSDWNIICTAKIHSKFFLAGGLNEKNIEEAIRTVNPYGIDISSGIETDGFKDRDKIKNIIELIRNMK